jgi:hypothetical protein
MYMNEIHLERQHTMDLNWVNKHDKNKKKRMQEKHHKKMNKLIIEQKKRKETEITTTVKIDKNNVINKSDIELTQDQLKVLSKSLKFAITPKSINTIDLITNVECSLYTVPTLTKQLAISAINTFLKHWKKPKNNNLNAQEYKALIELKNMKNIIIVNADKGGKL